MKDETGNREGFLERRKEDDYPKEKKKWVSLPSGIFARVLLLVQNNKAGKQDTQLSSLKCLNLRLKTECNDFKEREKEEKLSSFSFMMNTIIMPLTIVEI